MDFRYGIHGFTAKADNNIKNTLDERGSRYGKFEDNADITQELVRVIERAPNYSKLTNQHVEAFHMIFYKISRAVCGDPNYVDNIHDIVGYAKLLEDFLVDGERVNERPLHKAMGRIPCAPISCTNKPFVEKHKVK